MGLNVAQGRRKIQNYLDTTLRDLKINQIPTTPITGRAAAGHTGVDEFPDATGAAGTAGAGATGVFCICATGAGVDVPADGWVGDATVGGRVAGRSMGPLGLPSAVTS